MNENVRNMILALQGVNRHEMPFPNNLNPDMMFVNRFPAMPPAGIMNDLRPSYPEIPLQRKLNWQ